LFFHSYECQEIQTKNPFDEILSLSFDLGLLKVNKKTKKCKGKKKLVVI
jgi:hypothetical protein